MQDPQTRRLALIPWCSGNLARNSGALLGWMLLRAATQAATVLLLARELGANGYGQFVSILAMASFLGPFLGLGLSNIVLRNGAKDPAHLPIYLGKAARWWLITAVPCIALSILLAELLLPPGLPRLAAFAAIAAELATTSLTELRARHRQAQHRINAFGAINAGLPAVRLLALGLLFAPTNGASTETVLWTYAASSAFYLAALWLPMHRTYPAGEGNEAMSADSGLPFSLAGVATRLQAEFNKPVLAHVGFNLAGAYSVSQRFCDLASIPLIALQEASWPRLYAHADPMHALRRTGTLLLLLALACGACAWFSAPLLPDLLGHDYASTVPAIRGLTLLPLLQSFRALLNFHAIHHGRMQLIGWAYSGGAITGVVAVALLVPAHAMTGAVIASYASEAAMIALLVAGTTRRTK